MSDTAFFRGVEVPIGILALAFAILFFAGQAGSLGPLDFATYQWIIIGLWVAAPVVGGLLSRGLSDRQITRAAAVLAVLLGLAVAAFFSTAAGTASSCASGAVGSAAAYILGCLGVGAMVGIGAGASELITARLARRGWWLPAVLLGGGLSFAASAGAYFLYYSVVTCLR
jgi:hypothetical protein